MSCRPPSYLWLILFAFTPGESARGQSEAVPATDEKIAALITRLGDRDYFEREAAGKELTSLGEVALQPLRTAAARSPVPEVSARAGRVVRAILLGCRTSKSTGLEMVLTDTGEFLMGSPTTERGRRPDERQHRVRFDQPYLIGKYEVTQDEYRVIMNASPSWFSRTGAGKDKVGERGTGKFPVEHVSWFDAVEFCNRLSKSDGHTPYYTLSDVREYEAGGVESATVKVNGGNGFRLPTEAEWEYACRSGTNGPFHSDKPLTGTEGNFKMIVGIGYGSQERPSLGRTTAVGSYKAGPWGLCDAHGNVAEWCGDWYDADYYSNSPADNPPGPANGDHRVVRGGSWMMTDSACRSAARFHLAPGERKEYVGFRVVRKP